MNLREGGFLKLDCCMKQDYGVRIMSLRNILQPALEAMEEGFAAQGYLVRMGPDVERLIQRDGRDFFEEPEAAQRLKLLEDEIERVTPFDELWEEEVSLSDFPEFSKVDDLFDEAEVSTEYNVTVEGGYVEYCVDPSAVNVVADRIVDGDQVLSYLSQNIGAQSLENSEHWHTSVVKDHQDCFYVLENGSRVATDLFRYTVVNLLTMHSLFPAFFRKPFVAESSVLRMETSAIPSVVGLTPGDTFAGRSIMLKHGDEDVVTLEGRISPVDPHQGAYLYAYAIENAICGDVPAISDEAKGAITCTDRELYDEGVYCDSATSYELCRGPGGYLEMLERTADNLRAHPDYFPARIAQAMMESSLAGYEDYLDHNPRAVNRSEIPNFEQRIRLLYASLDGPAAQAAFVAE